MKKVNPLAKRREPSTTESTKAELPKIDWKSDELLKKTVNLDARKAVLAEWLAKHEADEADAAGAAQREVEAKDEHENEDLHE